MNKLIFNRTLQEVEYAKTATSTVPLRGAYNADDINRVNNAVNILGEKLKKYGYGANVSTKYMDLGYILKHSDAEQYLNNIAVMHDCFYVFSTTPAVPKIENWIKFTMANDIEKILFDVYELIGNMEKSVKYVGDIMIGDD